jgi:TonB family protein
MLIAGAGFSVAGLEHTAPRLPGLVKWVDPEYPPALYRRHITGKGYYLLKIDSRTGEVTEVKVLESAGYKILDELAAKAYLQCRFKPGSPAPIRTCYEFYYHGFARVVR